MRRIAPAVAAALLLAACGQGEGGNAVPAAEPESNHTASGATPSQDLAALVAEEPRLKSLIDAAGMQPVLSGKEPYTLLAPTGQALDRIDQGIFGRLDQPEQKADLTALLRAHILPGTILMADLERAVDSGGGKATIATMAGEPLTVTRDGEGLRIAGPDGRSARIVGTERPARNGVIHAVDGVLTGAVRTS